MKTEVKNFYRVNRQKMKDDGMSFHKITKKMGLEHGSLYSYVNKDISEKSKYFKVFEPYLEISKKVTTEYYK